jgi:succinate dehydrogenase/fumarate reductase cytochrome b subunit
MDFNLSVTLVSFLLFVMLASKQAYDLFKKVSSDQNVSLLVRGVVFALLMHVVQGFL